MTLNSATISLIKSHEGLRLSAYADPGYGWDVATIGYGHTSKAGPPSPRYRLRSRFGGPHSGGEHRDGVGGQSPGRVQLQRHHSLRRLRQRR